MRTDDLIAALAADNRASGPRPALSHGLAALAGGVVSLSWLLWEQGVRSDILDALATWRFDLKLVLIGLAIIVALIECIRVAGPSSTGRSSNAIIVVPVLLALAVAVELAATPTETWTSRAIGTNALECLRLIPIMSAAPLVLGLLAMRSAAPGSAFAAGVTVGCLAAAIGAAVYAIHCFDDSPLFVALWYPLAAIPVIATGTLAGRLLLRW
ncbi:MAG: DUF1109 family protein [Hyphomicrobiales bacterium]|nr:DUF1109 family protein [Hyphomicrobiales bacterium]